MQTKDNAKFHIVLVSGWIERSGQYLLSQRSATELQRPSAWSLPGGKVDSDSEEANILQKTLKTEIRDEVGIEIYDDMQFLYNKSFRRVDGAHVINTIFLCHYKSGEASALEDTADVRWFSMKELKSFSKAEDFLKEDIAELARYVEKNAQK